MLHVNWKSVLISNFFCAEYFLEDIVQLLNYQPIPDNRKRKNKDKEEESIIAGQDHEENCNLIVSEDYPSDVKARVGMISEKDVDFEIIEVNLFLRNVLLTCKYLQIKCRKKIFFRRC